MILRPLRLFVTLGLALLAAAAAYYGVTLLQVWLTSRQFDARPASAIVVMGAAQYDGVPSPDLRSRLDEAAGLYRRGYAHVVVVTGSKEKGDQFTEAQSGDAYLRTVGLAAGAIVEVGGSDSYENLSQAAAVLKPQGHDTVLIATDPFHEDRSMAIAATLGLTPSPTPTRTSPIRGWAAFPYYLREAAGVSVGRILGYGRLSSWVR